MPLVLSQGRSLDVFQKSEESHFLPDFVKTFEVEHAFLNTLKNILSSQNVGNGSLFGDSLELDVSIHDQRTVSVDIHDQGVVGRFDLPNFFEERNIVMMLLNVDVDGTTVDDDHRSFALLLLLRIRNQDFLLRFVNDTYQLQSDFILEVHAKMGKKKYRLLDDAHVRFEDEFLLQIWLNVLEEILFFRGFQRNAFELVFLLLDVVLHLVAQLSRELVMIPQFVDSFLVIVELLIFFLDFVDCDTDNVDHVPKNGGSDQLDNHYEENFDVVLGC